MANRANHRFVRGAAPLDIRNPTIFIMDPCAAGSLVQMPSQGNAMERIIRAGLMLTLAVLLGGTLSGCQTLRTLGSWKLGLVPTDARTIAPGDIPDLARMYSDAETSEQAFHRVQAYCAEVIGEHRQNYAQKRTHKNMFATLGVIAGTIIAPVLAQGSAVRAWAGVSGASAGALSTLFDSVEGSTNLTQNVMEISRQFGAADSSQKRELTRELLFLCRVNETRAIQSNADEKKPVGQRGP